jgi:hypothetical protein
MSETARARASRRNASKSTGPRTAAGKAIVARNATKHGLSLPVLADPCVAPEVEVLARTVETSVTGRACDAPAHALAARVAETMIDLGRVRDAKRPVVAALHADPRHAMTPLRELGRLDRYERRALSRRRSAVREFAAAVAAQGDVGRTKLDGKGE